MDQVPHLVDQLHKMHVRNDLPSQQPNFFPCGVVLPPSSAPKTPIAQATKHQKQSPRATSPFYHPELTLEGAAQHIHKILLAASKACDIWLKAPTNPRQDHSSLVRMSEDIGDVVFLLEHGRRGWDLTFLPENFFVDMEQLLSPLIEKTAKLSKKEGCVFMNESAVAPLETVKARLAEIKTLRKRIYDMTKTTYERQVEAGISAHAAAAFGGGKSPEDASKPGVDYGALARTKAEGHVELVGKADVRFGEECEFMAGCDSAVDAERKTGEAEGADEAKNAKGKECGDGLKAKVDAQTEKDEKEGEHSDEKDKENLADGKDISGGIRGGPGTDG